MEEEAELLKKKAFMFATYGNNFVSPELMNPSKNFSLFKARCWSLKPLWSRKILST